MEQKPCTKCGDIDRSPSGKCRPCARKNSLRRYANDPERVLAKNKRWQERNPEDHRTSRLKTMYGISPEEYELLLTNQGSKCAVCKVEDVYGIDHCHSTGKVRGLLCRTCNCMLGLAKDNPEILRLGAEYLEMKDE